MWQCVYLDVYVCAAEATDKTSGAATRSLQVIVAGRCQFLTANDVVTASAGLSPRDAWNTEGDGRAMLTWVMGKLFAVCERRMLSVVNRETGYIC
jgi:hypothetical protein